MKAISRNRIIAVMAAIVVFMVSMCTYSSSAEASTSTRTYWRHDYSNSDLSSYYVYSLTTTTSNTSANSRAIIGENDMVRDYDTSVVRLSNEGSGFIIGDHLIATAAHCVYDKEANQFYDFFIDIVDSNNNVIESIEPRYAHICSTYGTQVSNRWYYDYALIYVEEDLSEYGAFNLGIALDEYIDNNGSVTVSGFPKVNAYPPGYADSEWGIRFKASGNLVAQNYNDSLYTENYRINYYADAVGGDSGGPVYVEESYTVNGTVYENRTVIGIHTNSPLFDGPGFYNSGVKITNDLLKFYGGNTYVTA